MLKIVLMNAERATTRAFRFGTMTGSLTLHSFRVESFDVGDANEEGSRSPRLYEPAEHERAHYTTLSHRWGNKIPFQTKLQNIEAHRNSIDINTLPKSFRDAVSVTRALGVQYVWINAICIIQNDRSD